MTAENAAAIKENLHLIRQLAQATTVKDLEFNLLSSNSEDETKPLKEQLEQLNILTSELRSQLAELPRFEQLEATSCSSTKELSHNQRKTYQTLEQERSQSPCSHCNYDKYIVKSKIKECFHNQRRVRYESFAEI